ncbi:hypothetical protein GCM10011390_20050 [Aureimonas endophytica]|uniref:Uncharacterized protein n=2 Tax=Aureimonas endophytica TaxID=2027858 RepID=A0A917E455_9HYPH|nr:hypothetical protein GCM10011390_20050 [Aureimonas endophytica]
MDARSRERSQFLVVVRTHYIDEELIKFVRRIESANCDIVIAAEEGKHECIVPADLRKVSLNAESLSRLRLFFKPNAENTIGDAGWRCGDYSLYAAREAFPDYPHYLLIEPDVEIRTADLAQFMDRLARQADRDFMACNLRLAPKRWFWAKTMEAFGQPVWRCIFPFVWASAAALDLALLRRQELSLRAASDETIAEHWPNDEAFVATTLCNSSLQSADFSQMAPQPYDESTVSFHRPFSRALLRSGRPDEKLYHPVLADEQFTRKAEKLLAVAASRKRLAAYHMFTPDFHAALRAECGDEVARDFTRRLEAELRAIGRSRTILAGFLLARKLYHRVVPSAE